MNTTKISKCVFACAFLGFLFALVGSAPAAAIPSDAAKMVPADALVYAHLNGADVFLEKCKTMPIYGLYTDPAMQPVVEAAKTKINEKIDELLKEIQEDSGVSLSRDNLPTPKGAVSVALFLQTIKDTIPDYSVMQSMSEEQMKDFDPKTLPQKEISRPDFQIVAWADMADNAPALRELLDTIVAKTVEQNNAVRQTETIRGIDITILKKTAESNPDIDTPCFGFLDNTFFVGSSLKYLSDAIRRIEDDAPDSLASSADFQVARKTLGDSDLFAFLNIQQIIRIVKDTAGSDQLEKINTTLNVLGLDSTPALALSCLLNPDPAVQARTRVLWQVKGQRKGVPALLTPVSKPLQITPLMSRNLYSFAIANYDLGKMYDQIISMVAAISGMNPEMMLQSSMAMTGTQGENATPPVNLRMDVFDQLAGPLQFIQTADKPYSAPENNKMFFACGVRDAQKLDNALGRIHSTFIAKQNPQLKREFLDANIYLLPGGTPFFPMMGPAMMADPAAPPPAQAGAAFAVAAGQFLIGPVESVEQAIRGLRQKDAETIAADPFFQNTVKHLPAQAGAFSYDNQQIGAEILWTMLKEAAEKAAAAPVEAPESETPENPDQPAPRRHSPEDTNPFVMLIKQIQPYCDLRTLPEFDKVRHYFGTAAGSLQDHEQGLFAEALYLRPPQK